MNIEEINQYYINNYQSNNDNDYLKSYVDRQRDKSLTGYVLVRKNNGEVLKTPTNRHFKIWSNKPTIHSIDATYAKSRSFCDLAKVKIEVIDTEVLSYI